MKLHFQSFCKRIFCFISAIVLLNSNFSNAQIPAEVFGGHEKTTLDILFFKFFKTKAETNTRFLFFNRNRASLDYKLTDTTYLPQFGFTEAFSYNHEKLKGFAPVAVVQLSNKGVYPKAGIQFFKRKNKITFFSWVVCETLKNPYFDWFVLSRFEPKLTEKLDLFLQLELFSALPTASDANYSFVQRARIGLKIKTWQFGIGGDFSEIGKKNYLVTKNIGIFLRHEF